MVRVEVTCEKCGHVNEVDTDDLEEVTELATPLEDAPPANSRGDELAKPLDGQED